MSMRTYAHSVPCASIEINQIHDKGIRTNTLSKLIFYDVLICHKHNDKKNKQFCFSRVYALLMGIVLMLTLVLMHLLMPTENQSLLKGHCRHSVK